MTLIELGKILLEHSKQRQYIRFFADKKDEVPTICRKTSRKPFGNITDKDTEEILYFAKEASEWFKTHPNGKMDYIWL